MYKSLESFRNDSSLRVEHAIIDPTKWKYSHAYVLRSGNDKLPFTARPVSGRCHGNDLIRVQFPAKGLFGWETVFHFRKDDTKDITDVLAVAVKNYFEQISRARRILRATLVPPDEYRHIGAHVELR